MIQLRESRKDDTGQLVEIYESFYANQFPLDFSNSFAHILASDGNRIIGFGWLELQVEASIILDLNSRPRDKFEAATKIIGHGELVAASKGFKQMHAFPKDRKFTNILKKHLHFNDVTGDCLVKSLTNGEER